jgi:hypothetical protein
MKRRDKGRAASRVPMTVAAKGRADGRRQPSAVPLT